MLSGDIKMDRIFQCSIISDIISVRILIASTEIFSRPVQLYRVYDIYTRLLSNATEDFDLRIVSSILDSSRSCQISGSLFF